MKTNAEAIFLDTSIAIARMVHSPETKLRIEGQLSRHELVVSSLVVKQEFKRRLLKEAQYLLDLLNKKGSLEAVLRHIVDVLPRQWERKRNICLDMLTVVFETASDTDRTERARRYLRLLLRVGLADFANSVNYVVWRSGCACSYYPVTEVVPYKRYDFGNVKCSRVSDGCGIEGFFELQRDAADLILTELRVIPVGKKSAETLRMESFLESALHDPGSIPSMDPCLTVGDLLIALESAGIHYFYTMNGKESQHLCRTLNQTLIVRPKNPEHEDIVCLSTDDVWREF